MDENQTDLDQLEKRLEALMRQQEQFQREITELRAALRQLKPAGPVPATAARPVAPPPAPRTAPPPVVSFKPSAKPDLEKFIGENLANKIGIVITVLGVGIGAKYAIDRELVSPALRIVLGYLAGLALLGFALRLRRRYENFSAVLLSGAMAILYFITFAAYSFYGLIPQAGAFALMVLFTAATVFAALHYNRPVIAQFGLVGAYAVPFLLSEGADRPGILFGYMAIINAGILAIAFRRSWTSLYYSSFFLTWTIFGAWFFTDYAAERHFDLALAYAAVFFLLFYATFLAYRSVQTENQEERGVFLLLVNAFVFYLLGCALLSDHVFWKDNLGGFTALNALFHGAVSLGFYLARRDDRNLFYLLSGLAVVFLAIAVPIEFSGNRIALLWAALAVALFWIGRARNAPVYHKLAYPLFFLTFWQDQGWLFNSAGCGFGELPDMSAPLLNPCFFTHLAVAGAFGLITWLMARYPEAEENQFRRLMRLVVPAMFLYTLYVAFAGEIRLYFWNLDQKTQIRPADDSGGPILNNALPFFETVWLQVYTMVFLTILSLINLKKIKSLLLGRFNAALNIAAALAFLITGFAALEELRGAFLHADPAGHFPAGNFHIGIRYVALAALAGLLLVTREYVRQGYLPESYRNAANLALHLTLLWVASSELIHWLDLAGFDRSDRFALSILWGMYALLLIVLGINQRQRHLRLAAIVLFAGVLLKLFFYDLAGLSSLAKTAVLMSLGVLLLVISFLYNKYKDSIA